MADYFTHFSVMLERLTPEEAAWLSKEIKEAAATEDLETGGTMAEFEARLEAGSGGFAAMWLHDDGETANLEQVATLVQRFLKKFRPGDCWGFEWSADCSKPRLDAYGGGAVFVTADEIRWLLTGDWLDEQEKKWARLRKST